MNEFSITAAVLDTADRMIASTSAWNLEYTKPAVRRIVDETLIFFRDSDKEMAFSRNFDSDTKTLLCFPVLSSDGEQTAVLIIRDRDDNKGTSILKVYHDIFENFEEGYFELDIKGNVTYCNERISEITGIPRNELYGLNYRNYTTKNTPDQLFAVYSEIYRTSRPSKISDFEVIKRDGTTAVYEVSSGLLKDDLGAPMGFRAYAEMHQTESRLKMTEGFFRNSSSRPRDLSRSHHGRRNSPDFNNLLMSIQGYLSLLQIGIDPNSKVNEYLKRIEEHVEKGASLTKQMLGLSFSDAGISNFAKTDINIIMKKSADLFL